RQVALRRPGRHRLQRRQPARARRAHEQAAGERIAVGRAAAAAPEPRRPLDRARACLRSRIHRLDRRPAAAPSVVQGPARGQTAGRASADRIEIAGIELTHADRILYPEQGLTKLDLARYYEKIAARMLPHLADRPLTLLRCPEGYGAACFYQRHSKEKLDPAIRPVRIKENKS